MLSDEKGYIYKPNVNIMEEMANMISASRSYETNVQVADAAKQMVSRTLMLGQR
jgi:flagellar basal-body rod protein FlgC